MSKEKMMSAGCPAELIAAADAKAVPWDKLFGIFQSALAIMGDSTKSSAQKVFAILMLVLTLIPSPAPPAA